jgi:hypothetical protein
MGRAAPSFVDFNPLSPTRSNPFGTCLFCGTIFWQRTGNDVAALFRPTSLAVILRQGRAVLSTVVPSRSEVTRTLPAAEQGGPHAAEQLLPRSTSSCAGWRRPSWVGRGSARRWGRPLWSMRLIGAWWTLRKSNTGAVGGNSSPPQPRRCDGYSWSGHATSRHVWIYARCWPALRSRGTGMTAAWPSTAPHRYQRGHIWSAPCWHSRALARTVKVARGRPPAPGGACGSHRGRGVGRGRCPSSCGRSP